MSAQVGVRTRARAALAMETATLTSAQPSPKRKNMSSDSNQDPKPSKSPRTTTSSSHIHTNTLHSPTSHSCCSTNGSTLLHHPWINLLDLQLHTAQLQMPTSNAAKQIHRKEMNRSSELREDSQEPESMGIHSRCVTSKALTMPTELELEEFFSAAEKDLQKRFQDKYNYDIVKDVALEGRYEWVQLKP
ncbi:hypothetical protein VNO78_08190 [Psophocarpus tetragonolobus]|uniref:Cyclin-dependent kinase inhibitor domain-containing protein n=1 Tax=Psophocarpus tetragonolobus TaxID=3891 RepID=A0AAN9T4P0_PSOTE